MTLDAPATQSAAERRLQDAYNRYVDLYDGDHRPGTPGAFRTAQARLDLTLCLAAEGEDLPELVESQVSRDASILLSATPALPEA